MEPGKITHRVPIALPGLLGLVLCFIVSPLTFAQNQADPQREKQIQQQSNDTQSARPFEGRITKPANSKDGKLVLKESSTGQLYSLDDQAAVRPFAGKSVKVIATIDQKTGTLHIVDIAPAGAVK
jgi:hypothetical protein